MLYLGYYLLIEFLFTIGYCSIKAEDVKMVTMLKGFAAAVIIFAVLK